MATKGINGDGAFKLSEQPAYTPTRKMRVVCVGAGFSGLMVAHKIQHELKLEDEVHLEIFDRNHDIGGTWLENTYPGAGCDIPSHTYVFPFEGNPDWSSFYAGQEEILAYIKRTADKYNLRKYVQLNTTILEAIWNEDAAAWKLKVEQGGEVKEVEADFLINGGGFLNKWKWPNVKGLHEYKGKLVHTAKWDPDYDYTGKKVAVIGNGSSGIQVVPAMQPKVEKLVNFVRQRTWISVNFLGEKTPAGVNFQYSEEQKKTWREDPKALYQYRKELEQGVNAFYYVMCLDHPLQQFYEGLCRDKMHASTINAPELEKRTVPDYRPGCRRLSPGEGYLEALQQPNCKDSWDVIESFTEKGIKTVDGQVQEFDMIVCASGFDSSWIPQFKMVGRNGATLNEMWKDDPRAFFATQVENFPNYGIVNGPNPPISHGSVLSEMDFIISYLMKWIMRMNRQNIRTIEVKKEAVEDFNEYSQELLKRTVWSGECRTLYKNGRATGRITGVYAGSMMHFKNGLDNVGGEHFNITWRSKNRFQCLGNGTAEVDANGSGNLAPYFTEAFAHC